MQSFFEVGINSIANQALDFTVTINNCIIDNWVFTQDVKPNFVAGTTQISGNLNTKYVFKNLTFSNNNVTYHPTALIIAPRVEIYDSSFINNTITADHGALISTNIHS
eukprot:183336_1